MAENSFAFTAVSGAPAYSADDVCKWLYDRMFQGDGVLKGLYNNLAVTSDNNGNALIDTGSATKTGHGYYNDSVLTKSLTLPASGYTNINSIVVRVDSAVSPNTMHVVILVGTSVTNGSTPSAPAITSASDVYLADIKIVNSSGSYTYLVTDKRVYIPIINNGLLGNGWESILEAASSEMASSADLAAHEGVTGSSAHGAVSAATPNEIVTRDGNGNAQFTLLGMFPAASVGKLLSTDACIQPQKGIITVYGPHSFTSDYPQSSMINFLSPYCVPGTSVFTRCIGYLGTSLLVGISSDASTYVRLFLLSTSGFTTITWTNVATPIGEALYIVL